MSFTYNLNIPFAPNNPSADQPLMETNTNSINNLLAVDHVSFNTLGGGQHLQVTFNSENVPGVQTDPTSVLYTAGIGASTKANLFFRNSIAIFQINLIKAFATFQTIGAGVVFNQNVNFASIAFVGGKYLLTLDSNIIFTSTPGVVVNSSQLNSLSGYGYSAPVLTVIAATTSAQITVMMLEV